MKALAAQEQLLEKHVQADLCLDALLAEKAPPAARTRRAARKWRGRRLAAIRAAKQVRDDALDLWTRRWDLLWHKDIYLPAAVDAASIRLQLKVLAAFAGLLEAHKCLTSVKRRDKDVDEAVAALKAHYRRLDEEAGNIDLLAEDSGPLSEEEEVSIDLLE